MSFDSEFELIDYFVEEEFPQYVEEHLSEVLQLPFPIEPYAVTKLAKYFIIALKNKELSPTDVKVLLKINYLEGTEEVYELSSKGQVLFEKIEHLEFEQERFCRNCGNPLVSTQKNYCAACVSAVAREPWHKR